MTPYPLIFCPPDVAKPACCPHAGQVRQTSEGGPEKTGGTCWGGPFDPAGAQWIKSRAGWWLGLIGHKPQDLTRLESHPRVMRWRVIDGALDGHFWRVPVLLTPADEMPKHGYISALDRLWNGSEWTAPQDLAALQEPLLAIVHGIPLKMDLAERDAAIRGLAIGLLTVGHWIDHEFLAMTGWLSESLILATIRAALDQGEGASE